MREETRETYAASRAGAARAEQVHSDMTHFCSYDTTKAADRVYEAAYARALEEWDALSPLDIAARSTIRAALVAASGNVRAASRALYPERSPRGAYDKLHREIDRLLLRPWLTEEYERAARQPER